MLFGLSMTTSFDLIDQYVIKTGDGILLSPQTYLPSLKGIVIGLNNLPIQESANMLPLNFNT